MHKIIMATDFSRESEHALGHALDIARHTGAELVLLHVCPVIEAPEHAPEQVHEGEWDEWTNLLRAHMAGRREQLEELRSRVSGQGVEVSHMIADGEPAEGIVDSAIELGADLVVIGTHGLTGVQRLLLGSTAERVIRRTPVSVLVARERGRPAGGYKHILVPTDFSPSADSALDRACELVAGDGTVSVRHYWHEPVFGPVLDLGTLADRMERSVGQLGAERLERHRSDRYRIEFAADGGPPKQQILEELDSDPSYDLVVMGSHGRRGARRWLVGSTAESTARYARCSVLVAKLRAGSGAGR